VNTLNPGCRNISSNTLKLGYRNIRVNTFKHGYWNISVNTINLGYRNISVNTLKLGYRNTSVNTFKPEYRSIIVNTAKHGHRNIMCKDHKSWISHSLNLQSPRFDTSFYQPYNTTTRDIKYPAMQACAIDTIPPLHIQYALKLACCWEHEQNFSFIYNFLTPLPPSCTLPVTWLMTTLTVMDTWFYALQVSSVLISLQTAVVFKKKKFN